MEEGSRVDVPDAPSTGGGTGAGTPDGHDDSSLAREPSLDLRAPDEDPWSDLDVPASWAGVAEVARSVHADLETLADGIVDHIDESLPGYVSATVVPREDLHSSILRNLDTLLVSIARKQGPTAETLAVRRLLGRRRALQGAPIADVVRAYELGFDLMWAELADRASHRDPETQLALLRSGPVIWQWQRQITAAISDTYAETRFARSAEVVGARQRLVELLVATDADTSELAQLAHVTGFDPDGDFQALLVLAPALDGSEVHRLQATVDELDGVHACVARGNRIVTVQQDGDENALLDVIRRLFPGWAAGIGLPRAGLAGAALSIGDAELAGGFAGDGETRRFHDVWLWAILCQASDRLAALLADGGTVAAEHTHLAKTIRAFADSGFSVTETARKLNLHANTVSYRLERWHALTGWDPRTFAGLARSLAALVVAR